MSLLCGKNPALEALKSVQDSIKTALASKKAGLATLTSKLAEAKSKAESLVASLPNLSSFQAELAALAGATPEQVAQFKAKWDGKVAELDSLVSKVTGTISGLADIDFCKDVPNVKMDPTTGETVEEAKEAQTPNVAPAKAEPVVETVVVKSESVSSGKSEVVPDELEASWQASVYSPYNAIYRPLQSKSDEAQLAEIDLFSQIAPENSTEWSVFGGRHERSTELETLRLKSKAATNVASIVSMYFDLKFKEYGTAKDPLTTPAEYVAQRLESTDPQVRTHMEDPVVYAEQVEQILAQNVDLVKQYYAYKYNMTPT